MSIYPRYGSGTDTILFPTIPEGTQVFSLLPDDMPCTSIVLGGPLTHVPSTVLAGPSISRNLPLRPHWRTHVPSTVLVGSSISGSLSLHPCWSPSVLGWSHGVSHLGSFLAYWVVSPFPGGGCFSPFGGLWPRYDPRSLVLDRGALLVHGWGPLPESPTGGHSAGWRALPEWYLLSKLIFWNWLKLLIKMNGWLMKMLVIMGTLNGILSKMCKSKGYIENYLITWVGKPQNWWKLLHVWWS
jgi:hypothetical protein